MLDYRCWRQVDDYTNKVDPRKKEKTDPASLGYRLLKNTEISKRLKFDGLIDDDFIDKVGRLPIDDLIALKLETTGKTLQEYYFGYELFYTFSKIVLGAVAKYFYSISPTAHGTWSALKGASNKFKYADHFFNLKYRLFGNISREPLHVERLYQSRLERIENKNSS